MKEEPKAGPVAAAAARPAARPAPRPREAGRGQGQEEDTGPPRVLRRGGRAAVPAKKAEPKYGYRRSSNRCERRRNEAMRATCMNGVFLTLGPGCPSGTTAAAGGVVFGSMRRRRELRAKGKRPGR